MIFDVVDADRGFILLMDEHTGAMVPRAIRYREELLEQIRREQAGSGCPAPEAPPRTSRPVSSSPRPSASAARSSTTS